jgi:hypothetical protein
VSQHRNQARSQPHNHQASPPRSRLDNQRSNQLVSLPASLLLSRAVHQVARLVLHPPRSPACDRPVPHPRNLRRNPPTARASVLPADPLRSQVAHQAHSLLQFHRCNPARSHRHSQRLCLRKRRLHSLQNNLVPGHQCIPPPSRRRSRRGSLSKNHQHNRPLIRPRNRFLNQPHNRPLSPHRHQPGSLPLSLRCSRLRSQQLCGIFSAM